MQGAAVPSRDKKPTSSLQPDYVALKARVEELQRSLAEFKGERKCLLKRSEALALGHENVYVGQNAEAAASPGLRVLCTVHCAAAWQARKVPRIAPPALPTPSVGTNKRQRGPGDGILWGIDWREEAPVSGAQRPPAPAWHRGAPVTCQWSVDQIVNRASVERGWVACAAKAYASGARWAGAHLCWVVCAWAP